MQGEHAHSDNLRRAQGQGRMAAPLFFVLCQPSVLRADLPEGAYQREAGAT